jgi:hypothetical protein
VRYEDWNPRLTSGDDLLYSPTVMVVAAVDGGDQEAAVGERAQRS